MPLEAKLATTAFVLLVSLPVLALAFGLLEWRLGSRSSAPRSPADTALDLACWFAVPLLTEVAGHFARIEALVASSPSAALVRCCPVWVQALAALVISDVAGWVSHRAFHGH